MPLCPKERNDLKMGFSVKYDKKRKTWIWRARVRVNGKQKEKSGSASSRLECEKKGLPAYTDLLKQKENQQYYAIDSNIMLKDFMKEWFQIYQEQDLRPETIKNRNYFIETRIYPEIGHIPLSKLNRMTYQKYINSLAIGKNKLSHGSIKILNGIVRTCLDYAVYDLRIIDYNPADKIRIPNKTTSDEKKQDELNKYYSEEELKLILADDKELPAIYALISLMSETGLRLGEATGLLEENYLKEERALLIDKQLSSRSKRNDPILGLPKTAESSRLVYLDDRTNELVKQTITSNREFRMRYGNVLKLKYHFIFNRKGYPIIHNSFREALKRICTRTGVPYHSKHPAHAFRHTHVKRLDEAGVSETAIQQRIGHKKGSRITRIYNHSDELLRRETIEKYSDYKSVKGL